MPAQRLDLAGLTTRIVGPDDAPITVVLLHGFGAPGDDLVALAQHIDAPVRFVFPEAPLELGGLYGDARAWWLLDLAKLEQELRAGVPRDRSGEIPDGLPAARDHVSRLLDQVKSRLGVEDKQLVIGGFSQGAMLSLDVALHRDTPPAGIILMSGTIVAESAWQPKLPKLAGVPILQSHGRHDMLLPFNIAEKLRDRLRAAGATVEWQQFVGGHEIPPIVLDAVGKFLRARAT
ncbi:MAG: putative Carboxylesterase [Myxococcales bacterium]|nr:putative Carboxylesterase [Myxococcales bacterium]